MRARHLKSTLAAADRSQVRDAVRAALPPGLAGAVEAANGFDWLPAANDVALVRAIHGALGDAEHHAFSRRVILEAFEGPLLNALVTAGLRLFPGGLMAWAHWIPRGWGLVFRDCGEWAVELVGSGAADLRLRELPPICSRDEVWPRSVASSLSPLIDLARVRGTMCLVALDRAAGTASYQMRWEPAGEPGPAGPA